MLISLLSRISISQSRPGYGTSGLQRSSGGKDAETGTGFGTGTRSGIGSKGQTSFSSDGHAHASVHVVLPYANRPSASADEQAQVPRSSPFGQYAPNVSDFWRGQPGAAGPEIDGLEERLGSTVGLIDRERR